MSTGYRWEKDDDAEYPSVRNAISQFREGEKVISLYCAIEWLFWHGLHLFLAAVFSVGVVLVGALAIVVVALRGTVRLAVPSRSRRVVVEYGGELKRTAKERGTVTVEERDEGDGEVETEWSWFALIYNDQCPVKFDHGYEPKWFGKFDDRFDGMIDYCLAKIRGEAVDDDA